MRASLLLIALVGFAAVLTTVSATVLFHEDFKSIDKWISSAHRDDYGAIGHSAGKFYADAEKDKGLQLTQDARFYAVSAKLPTPITNDKKEFVVSFSVKHEQGLKCGGGYIKLLPTLDPKDFHGDSKYWLMFGPDRCGYDNNKVHIILNHDGTNHQWKKKVAFPDDKLTHVYTLRISSDDSYELYVDEELKEKGSLQDDWPIVQPKEISDATDKKPEDWVDEPTMADPEDKKPEDWDSEPQTIPDAEAKKPEDWDDAEDGEWEAPMIPNPKSKGPWHPKQIPNPAYKGPWEARMIPNPDYKPIPDLYKIPEALEYVGIDVWQVESGSIFNNIIIGDDVKEVLEIVKGTYGASKKAESDAFEAFKKAEDAAAKAEEANTATEVTIDNGDTKDAEEEGDL
uniref:Calreticulin n=1 Tax=Trypanosoma carassii TaxID=38249 RepID=C8CIJ1_9TRYP|nr:calreticulin [Trypanosoma carassii]